MSRASISALGRRLEVLEAAVPKPHEPRIVENHIVDNVDGLAVVKTIYRSVDGGPKEKINLPPAEWRHLGTWGQLKQEQSNADIHS